VGRFEGDTLVVDTIGLTGTTWLDDHGNRHSDALHLIERFRRVSANQIAYEQTYDDPKYYTKPWVSSWMIVKADPKDQLLEYACTDFNYSNDADSQQPGPIDGSGRDGGPLGVPGALRRVR
jgi:hypothetical protein